MTPSDQHDSVVEIRALAEALSLPFKTLEDLHSLHWKQWSFEDAARIGPSPYEAGLAKAKIDHCNARRHELIDFLDSIHDYEPVSGASQLYSETPGETADRVLIALVKRDALRSRIEGQGDRAALDLLDRKISHLLMYCRAVGSDRAERRAVFPPRVEPKLYPRPSAGERRPVRPSAY
jgi:hypothetical protein